MLFKILQEYWNRISGVYNSHNKDEKESTAKRFVVEQLVGLINSMSSGMAGSFVKDFVGGAVGGGLSGYGFVVVEGRLVYRGRPGAGSVIPPLEAGLSVHPVFLVPFVPGSSVKGAMRSAYHSMLMEHLGVNVGERSPVVDACVEAVFGGVGESAGGGVGALAVFDAFMVEGGVVGDVLTPHYAGPGRRVETEFDAEPVPVLQLSVREGSRFLFVVGVDEEYGLERIRGTGVAGTCLLGREPRYGEVTRLALRLLVRALSLVGVGGRSGRGYGFFEPVLVESRSPRFVRPREGSRARCA
jgi:CRISPR type III-B/RAMP module RAMP protein Cmr6